MRQRNEPVSFRDPEWTSQPDGCPVDNGSEGLTVISSLNLLVTSGTEARLRFPHQAARGPLDLENPSTRYNKAQVDKPA
jgi:hypothetical protein